MPFKDEVYLHTGEDDAGEERQTLSRFFTFDQQAQQTSNGEVAVEKYLKSAFGSLPPTQISAIFEFDENMGQR